METSDQTFSLQGRMIEPINSTNSTGTSFVALAMKLYSSPTIQLEIIEDKIVVFVNGEELDFAGLAEQQIGNVTVERKGNETFVVRFTNGISVHASNRNLILTNILVTLPEDLSTKGLLGQFNHDPSDDLLPWNSTLPLPLNSALEEIHYQFGLSCKQNAEKLLHS